MTHLQGTTMDCSGADVTLAQWAVRGAGGKAKGQEEGRGAAQPPAVGSLPSLQGWGLWPYPEVGVRPPPEAIAQ